MRHEITVFASLMKLIPRATFNALVKKHGMDVGVRGLTTRAQFCAMLFAQLSGAASLRDLVTSLATHKALLYHAGIKDGVRRSTLADANRDRPHAFFDDLFAALLAQLPAGLPRKMRQTVRLIDSTNLRLSALSSAWARFSGGVFAAKLHVVYDPNEDRPVYFVTTPANVNDITPAKTIAIEPQATYVFDLGYYDFAWWAALDAQGCRLVTRLKKNTRLSVVAENKVPKGSAILSDRIGHLPERLTFSRKNPFSDPVREVCVRIDGGTVLRLITNDLDAPAQEIADLYKSRWQIELFFRWIKQTLKIKHFLGVSENAVRVQVAVALIAFILLRAAQTLYGLAVSPLTFARLIRTALTHRRSIPSLLDPPDTLPQSQNQLTFELAQC
jgi:hypothetical protein